jgi:hypothetical protein
MKFWMKEKKKMGLNQLDSLFFFLFLFSILYVLRIVFRFMSALLQNPPKKLILSDRELFLINITISYIITYIFKL